MNLGLDLWLWGADSETVLESSVDVLEVSLTTSAGSLTSLNLKTPVDYNSVSK
jgi:hypothetical protein